MSIPLRLVLVTTLGDWIDNGLLENRWSKVEEDLQKISKAKLGAKLTELNSPVANLAVVTKENMISSLKTVLDEKAAKVTV